MRIKRWTNGCWYHVAFFSSKIEAEYACIGLNQFGEWLYEVFE